MFRSGEQLDNFVLPKKPFTSKNKASLISVLMSVRAKDFIL